MNNYLVLGFICLIFCNSCNTQEIFDLSHDYGNDTINWPGATRIKVIAAHQGYVDPTLPENDVNNFWLQVNDIEGEVHIGTHLDAPVHFARNKWSVDKIPPNRFFAPVSIVDLRGKVKDNADYEITENDLTEWERVNGKKLDPLVILWTGWASRYPDRLRYLGTRSENETSQLHHFPGLSRRAAEWIANHGGIHGVGIDTASLDYGQSKDFMAHRILSENQIFIMEYLNTKGLESFPMVKPYLMVTPLKITGGSGSPVRALLLSQLPADLRSNSVPNLVSLPLLFILTVISFTVVGILPSFTF